MPGKFLAFDPIRDAEMKHWSVGQVDNIQSLWALALFIQNYDGGVVARGSVGRDLADGVFVAVEMGCAADVSAAGEDVGEEIGFIVQG